MTDWTSDCGTVRLICGDCLDVLRGLPDESVHCCVTSPPYWGLRDYGVDGQIGLEETPDAYVARMVEVFSEVKRVLREDGTLWLNLGDSYAGPKGNNRSGLNRPKCDGGKAIMLDREWWGQAKQLVGIPWRVAFALQADGWWLRSDIIWSKPNPMPESVTDRPTKAHEYVFLLAKSARYYYDAAAIQEPMAPASAGRYAYAFGGVKNETLKATDKPTAVVGTRAATDGRNRRSVWTVTTKPYREAHFATFPPKLIEPCILAGCPAGGTVLDPFNGSGTTGAVAVEHGRNYVGIELNPAYIEMAKRRIQAALDKRAEQLIPAA
jgi:DNA modification methylase